MTNMPKTKTIKTMGGFCAPVDIKYRVVIPKVIRNVFSIMPKQQLYIQINRGEKYVYA